MIVILCHPGDAAALWLGTTMRELRLANVEIVTVEELVYSRRIAYRLSDTGNSGSIALADGRTLRPESIAGLVNRVAYLPTQHFARAAPTDRAYAEAELSAFLLAWINGVAGRVVNPPLPLALGGGAFPPPTLAHLAATAGLPTQVWRASSVESDETALPPRGTHAAVVFDGRLFGALLPRPLQDACRRLAVLLGVSLLQVELDWTSRHGWRFAHASGEADFRIGGKPLTRDIAQAFARDVAA